MLKFKIVNGHKGWFDDFMVNKTPDVNIAGNTVASVFLDFLTQLARDKSIDPAIVFRLRKTLIENPRLDADAIREALFPKEKNS